VTRVVLDIEIEAKKLVDPLMLLARRWSNKNFRL
jgi:hypothetical protein